MSVKSIELSLAPRLLAAFIAASLCAPALHLANPSRSRVLAPSQTHSVLNIHVNAAFLPRRADAALETPSLLVEPAEGFEPALISEFGLPDRAL